MMKTLCITVDVDRDVNDVRPGSVASISLDRGNGTAPRFESSKKGAGMLLDLFDDIGVEATYFLEARMVSNIGTVLSGKSIGLHGLDHEDFTGEKSGITLDVGDKRDIIERAISMIRDFTGRQPKGMRFPYMAADEDTLSFLPEYGIRFDSSYYAYLDGNIGPYKLDNGIIEFPVAKCTDGNGKSITSYLWPMHEGTRKPEDFMNMLDNMNEGVFVFATHSWHMCETRKNGPMDELSSKENVVNLRKIIEHALDTGYEVRTMDELASR